MDVHTSRPPEPTSEDGASAMAAKVKDARTAVASTARRVPGPAVAAGAAAAGVVGGLALGARVPPGSKVLGLPLGRRRRSVSSAVAVLAGGARQLGAVAGRAFETADDIHQIREHLAVANRRSPVEALLDGLTHRRGAHRLEQ